MRTVTPIVLLLLTVCLPAAAQTTAYSIDNFDFHNGVKVYKEPPARLIPRPGRKGKSAAKQNQPAPDKLVPAADAVSTAFVKPTLLAYDSALNAAPVNANALRGYTTGSSVVDGYLLQAGANNGVDPLLIYSVMHQESSFKSRAISPKGARGLMQLMPGTAVRYGVTNIFDPKQNIEGGARYLRFLLDRFDGDVNLALAGYNAGEGAVEKFGWRIPPYSETQEYVRRISRRYALLRDPNAALYAPRLNGAEVARLQAKPVTPLTTYERTVSTIRLPDGRLQLMSQ